MSVFKKSFLALLFSFIGILVFSISAFAADIEFSLSDYPMHTVSNNSDTNNLFYFIKNYLGNYYYIEFISNKNTGSWNANFDNYLGLSLGGFDDGNDYYNLLPFISLIESAPGNYRMTSPCSIFIYDTTGALVYSNSNLIIGTSSQAYAGLYVLSTNWAFNGTDFSSYYRVNNQFDYFCTVFPDSYLVGNQWSFEHSTTGYPDYLLGYYNIVSSTEQFSCSIEDNIYVNGILIYGSSGGGGNIASSIIGSAIGNLIPEYDENGNITNIITNNTYEFDITPFTESDGNQPEPWDNSAIDDYNSSNDDVQDSISDFKGQFAFSDVFGDDFDLTSFRGAMTFWKDRFDEVMDFNPVFPVLITTSLTLGLVAVILGRKLGVG